MYTASSRLARFEGASRKITACLKESRLPYRVQLWVAQARLLLHGMILNRLLKTTTRGSNRTISPERAVLLHKSYPRQESYKYDLESKRERALARLRELEDATECEAGWSVLEIGAGDGQLALALNAVGMQPVMIDLEDWRDQEVRQSGIDYHLLSAGDNPYPLADSSMDLVVSFNTLEHIEDVSGALNEMVRVARPGGFIYLSFGPLYNSPYGLHAHRTYHGPYPQFMLDSSTLNDFVRSNGIHDLGRSRAGFQYVNGWSLTRYRQLFESLKSRIEILTLVELRDDRFVRELYRHLRCFSGRGLSFDELTVSEIRFLGRVRRFGQR